MRKNLLQSVALVLLLAISIAGHAQNLVLNPSFEITNNNACPAGISEFGLATDWGEGNSGQTNCTTSDLYAGCASQIGGANSPNALLGFQASRTGTHHAGIILAEGALGCALMGSNYREYIEGKLSQPLTAGQKYVVRFYMSMPDEVMGATDDFGVYFSNTYYSHDACVTQLMPVTPQLNYCGPPIVDTLGWTEVKWIYTAVGGETFFTIGNFKNDGNTTLAPVNCGGFVQNPYLYYFIDDVEVSPAPPSTGGNGNVDACEFTLVTSSTPKGCTANDGTATVVAAGCSAPFQYAWAGGGSNATLNNLAAGTYTVTVSDANCSATSTVSVAASTAPAVQITSINANCGASNGTAIANPTGTGPFTYAWSGGGNAQVKNNLGAGTYTVTVTGAGNCTATASAAITASAGSLSLTGAATPASCGLNTGTATVAVSGGSGPYTYSWSNNQTTQSITGLAAGNYTVTVTSSSASTATPFWSEYFTNGATGWTYADGPGTNGAQPNLWAVDANADCVCDSGSYLHITCNPASLPCSFGGGGCTYFPGIPIPNPLIGDPTTDKVAISPSISTIGKSNIVLKFKYTVGGDDSGRDYGLLRFSGDGGANWTEMPTKYMNQPTCNNAVVNVPNTFENKSNFKIAFRWVNNNDGEGDDPGFAIDRIELIESTVANCPSTTTVTVTSTNNLQATTTTTNANCGQNNGTATAVLPGGSGYVYVWNTGGNTATINNLGAGTYTVTVSAGANCSTTASAVVTASSGLSISTQAVNASCGGNSGSATVVVSGVGNYNYIWSSGANTATATNLAPGSYTVTVSQGNCSATASAVVVSSSGLSGTFNVTQPSCGQANGVLNVTNISGGVQPVNMEWRLNNAVISTNSQVNNLGSGLYIFHAQDANGCDLDTAFVLNSSGANAATLTADRTLICAGDSALVCAPAGYTAYLWNTGVTTQCIKVKAAGNYYVTVTDNGNCTATSNHLAIAVRQQPSVSISVSGDTLTSYNAAGYQWYLNGQPIPNATSAIYIANQGGSYQVLINDTAGCKALSNAIVITGIENITGEGVSVYPNPAVDGWYLTVTDDLVGATAHVYDNSGRLVYTSLLRNSVSEINFNAAKGVYMLRINTSNKAIAKKLIKL